MDDNLNESAGCSVQRFCSAPVSGDDTQKTVSYGYWDDETVARVLAYFDSPKEEQRRILMDQSIRHPETLESYLRVIQPGQTDSQRNQELEYLKAGLDLWQSLGRPYPEEFLARSAELDHQNDPSQTALVESDSLSGDGLGGGEQKLIQVKTQRRIAADGKKEIFLVGMNQWVEEAECKNPNATLMVGGIEIPWDRLLTPDEANQPVVDLSRILDGLPGGFRLSDLQGTESISTYVRRLSESNTSAQSPSNSRSQQTHENQGSSGLAASKSIGYLRGFLRAVYSCFGLADRLGIKPNYWISNK